MRIKLITIFSVLFLIIFGFYNICYAYDTLSIDNKSVNVMQCSINPATYKPTQNIGSTNKLDKKVKIILSYIQGFGMIVTVIALIVIGIRIVLGSIEEKTVYKEALPGYLLGIFLFAGCTTLPNIIYHIFFK